VSYHCRSLCLRLRLVLWRATVMAHDIKNIPARLTAPLNKCCQLTSAPQNVGLAGSHSKLPLYCSTCNLGNPLTPVSIYPFFPRFLKTFICYYFKLFFYYFYIFRIAVTLKIFFKNYFNIFLN
jgi:hypothetical protein